MKSETGVYSIVCTGCNKNYIGEISRSIKTYIDVFIRDFKIENDWNTLVKRNLETKHDFNFRYSKMLVNIHNNVKRLLNLVWFLITIQLNKGLFFFLTNLLI